MSDIQPGDVVVRVASAPENGRPGAPPLGMGIIKLTSDCVSGRHLMVMGITLWF